MKLYNWFWCRGCGQIHWVNMGPYAKLAPCPTKGCPHMARRIVEVKLAKLPRGKRV